MRTPSPSALSRGLDKRDMCCQGCNTKSVAHENGSTGEVLKLLELEAGPMPNGVFRRQRVARS